MSSNVTTAEPVTGPKIDRRSARTRQKLEQACRRLVARKPYDAIQVEEICAEAGVARSTFYAHYTGKDDLKRRGLDHLDREIAAAAAAAADAAPFAFAKTLFEHAHAHRDHIGALTGGRGDDVARMRLREIITANVRRDLGARSRGSRGDLAPQIAVTVAAFIGLLDWWLDEGSDRTAEDMAALFQKTATSGLIS